MHGLRFSVVWKMVGFALLAGHHLRAAPPNDYFTNRIVLSGLPVTTTGSNVGATATNEPGEPSLAGNIGGRSVWWTWTAPTSTAVVVTTAGSSFNTLLGVYAGTSVSNLTLVASDDDSGLNGTSVLSFQATNGVAYQIAVDGYCCGGSSPASGSILLTLALAPTHSPPDVSLTKLVDHAIFLTPTNLTLTATASSDNTNVSIAQVLFYEGGTNLLGCATHSPYSIVWSNPPPGLHQLTAAAVDSTGLTNTSLPATVTVTPMPRLRAVGEAAGAGFQLSLNAVGQRYQLLASSNLVDWTCLAAFTNVNAETFFTDSGGTNLGRRFYRAATASFDPGRIRGWLHASNTLLLDGSNHPVYFHGINSSGMEWGKGTPYVAGNGGYAAPAAEEYDKLAAWGFNVVRLPISWANIETNAPETNADGTVTHFYNEPYLKAVDQIVQQLGQRQIAVIFSMHQWAWSPAYQLPRGDGTVIRGNGMPPWLYPDPTAVTAVMARSNFFANVDDVQAGFIAAWSNVVRRYVTNATVIGTDMFNEPSTIADYSNTKPPSTNALDNFYERLGATLLAINPNLMLFFQQGPGTPVTNVLSFTNHQVYSFHEYPKNWSCDGLSWAKGYKRDAGKWQIPLWLGEFDNVGRRSITTGTTAWQLQTGEMLAWCRTNTLGWTYWAYQRSYHPLDGAGGTGPMDWDLLRFLQSEY